MIQLSRLFLCMLALIVWNVGTIVWYDLIGRRAAHGNRIPDRIIRLMPRDMQFRARQRTWR